MLTLLSGLILTDCWPLRSSEDHGNLCSLLCCGAEEGVSAAWRGLAEHSIPRVRQSRSTAQQSTDSLLIHAAAQDPSTKEVIAQFLLRGLVARLPTLQAGV